MKKTQIDAFSLLFGQDQKVLDSLQASCTIRRYSKGETIIHYLDSSQEVYYILGGNAKAYLLSAEGKELWMNDFGAGSIVGELAGLCDTPRVCSVAATTPVETAVFDATVFLELMRKHSEIGIVVATVLAKRLFTTSQRLSMKTLESLEARVYVELINQSAIREGDIDFTRGIRPVPVIAEIARRVGAARESVSRVLTQLDSDGYLIRNEEEWLLRNPDSFSR